MRIEHVTSVKTGHLGCDNMLFKRWVPSLWRNQLP